RLWALCPFHEERTPSFCVDVRNPDDEHYHCFGCATHGDVIDFVMALENCSFVEACERLDARRWPKQSVQVHRRGPVTKVAPCWETLAPDAPELHVLEMACDVFEERLWASERAVRYMQARAVREEVARKQRVGYADGRSLLARLRQTSAGSARGLALLEIADKVGLIAAGAGVQLHVRSQPGMFSRPKLLSRRSGCSHVPLGR